MEKKTIEGKDLLLIQSLADHDPDVDGIYRLTKKMPLKFSKKKQVLLQKHQRILYREKNKV